MFLKRLFKKTKLKRYTANHRVEELKKKGWKVVRDKQGMKKELTLMEK